MRRDTDAVPGQPAARRRTQDERSTATIKKLLEATITLIAKAGFVNLTTTMIAERAGASRGAMLHHFASKSALVKDATEGMWASVLKARGLDGVKLVVSDAHSGLKGAISRVFEATWQRCRVHWMRNALAHVSRGQHTVVAAAIRQAFDQPDRKHAGETWQRVADQLRPHWPKLADLMDASEHDVLAYMAFPRQHRTKLHSTNPIEHLNKEVKRRADVVGIFPNEASIMRLIGAVLFEQNDEWQTSSRYMMIEAFAQIDKEEIA